MIILIYGEDSYRAKQKISQMAEKFKEKYDTSGMNLDIFEFKENTDATGEIMNAVGSPPFLAKRRMIIVNGLAKSITKKADAKIWADRLTEKGDDTIIILKDEELTLEKARKNKLYVALSEAKEKIHEFTFAQMTNNEASGWIRQHTKATFNKDAIQELIQRAGDDTWKLKNELDKLEASTGSKTITKEIVEQLTPRKNTDTFFAFLDSVRSANKEQAITLLKNELQRGTPPAQLINMILREVQLLIELKAYTQVNGRGSERDAARALKIHPFVAKKALSRALSTPQKTLKILAQTAIKADKSLKTTKTTDKAVLEQLVIDITKNHKTQVPGT